MARDQVLHDELTPQQYAIDLDRLLERLQKNLLSADAPILKSPYERTKAGINVEYARALLVRLEHDNTPGTSTIDTDKARLQDRRGVLMKLQTRLYELNQASDNEDDRSDDGIATDDETADFLNKYISPRKDATSEIEARSPGTQPMSPDVTQAVAAAANMTSTLRSRKAMPEAPRDTATSSAASTSQAPKSTPALPFPPKLVSEFISVPGTEKLLENHDAEQESLTNSLLSLAQALKVSANAFSEELAASTPLVDRAAAALDKSVGGMEAAGKRMGMLRKVTEGRGFLSRLSLWAWIAILWLAVILIMGLMPKLRIRAW